MLIEQLGNLLSFFHHTVVNLSNNDITYNTNIMEYNVTVISVTPITSLPVVNWRNDFKATSPRDFM